MEIKYKISAQEFYEMRNSVDWKDINITILKRALENSMYVVGIYENEEIVAMGRIVGDFTFKALLSDIIVKPDYQKKGYGKIVVTKLLELANENMTQGETLCIEGTPTKGNIDFYVKCGFKYKPEIQDGVYVWLKK